MKSDGYRDWLIVASLFLTLFIVFGSGYDTAGVFFAPMLGELGWSRTRLSSLQTVLALTAGMAAPAVGWLLDRFEARAIMAAGVAFAGVGLMLASRAHSFALMVAAFIVLGAGICAATLLPCAFVIANWFGERRGTALGVTMAGASCGGMVMTLVAARAIAAAGWRMGFLILAMPMFLIALPLVLATVRTRPSREGNRSVADAALVRPGLDIGQAVRARSFWMIAVAQFCYSFASVGATVHTVPYLILIGYRPERAAQVLSATFGLAALGKPLVGYAADYLSGRIALALSLMLAALGQFLLLGARGGAAPLVAYALIYGVMSGAPLALIPMLIADSLGLKRFGSVGGITGVSMTVGAATGPLIAGWIFDVERSYTAAFVLFAAMLGLGAIAASRCSPLVTNQGSAKRTYS